MTVVIGDYHIKDLSKSPLDQWQYKCFVQSFKNIAKIIEKHKVTKLVLVGDTFDIPPKGNSLELFARFINMLKPYNLEIILIDGNHELITGQGRNYYCDIMKDYFKINYNIDVIDYKQEGDILYCNHKHINKLEKVKPMKLVYSHFRSNIAPIVDEIDVIAIHKNVELCILGDIHCRNQNKNIVYTGSPVDTHFDSNNDLEAHIPSVLLLNEETLEWKWVSTLTSTYRKKKKVYASVVDFLSDIDNLKSDYKDKHNFYKVVIQDTKTNLNRIKKSLYEEFCIIYFEAIDLDYNYENKRVANDIVKTLATTDTSKSLLEFCERNLTRKDLKDKLLQFYHKYEAVQSKGE